MLILDPLTCGADQDEDIQVQRMTFTSQSVPPPPTTTTTAAATLRPRSPLKALGLALAEEK